MPYDVRYTVANRPGSAAASFAALAEAGINIIGGCGDLPPGATWGYVHVLVSDGDAARRVLEATGIEVTGVHEVIVHELADRPGALRDLCKEYADRGEGIEVLYMAGDARWAIATEGMRPEIRGVRVGDS